MSIETLSKEDKKFLEEFVNLEILHMVGTGLKSTENFPEAPKLIKVRCSNSLARFG